MLIFFLNEVRHPSKKEAKAHILVCCGQASPDMFRYGENP